MPYRSLIRRAGIFATVLGITSCIIIGYSLWRDLNEAIEDAQRNNANMSMIVVKQLEQSVRMMDNLMIDIATMFPQGATTSLTAFKQTLNSHEMHELLKSKLQQHPLAAVISIIGSDGKVVVSTRSWPTNEFDFAQGGYFQQIRDSQPGKLAVSKTFTNRTTGDWTIYFGRKLVDADGNFLGYIDVGMKPDFFERLYEGVAQIPGIFIRLMRSDGYVLAGNADNSEPIVGRVPLGNEWYKVIAAGGGQLRTTGVYSGVIRLIYARPVRNYPLGISVGITETDVINHWMVRAIPAGLERALMAALVASMLYMHYLRTRAAKQEIQAQSDELKIANRRFDLVLSNMQQGVVMFDGRGRVLVRNQRFVEIYKLSPDDVGFGITRPEIMDLRVQAGTDRKLDKPFPSTLFERAGVEELRDGRHIFVTVKPMQDGGWISTHEDITLRHVAAQKIEHLASHDVLTGLANRAHFIARTKELLSDESMRDGFAILILDLDAFKSVNDTFGHLVGDLLLKEVANRILLTAGDRNIVARLGGDEFVILCQPCANDEADLKAQADDLLKEIGRPYFIDGRELRIGLSIGIALSSEEVTTSEDLMRRADIALYKAKSDGRNCARFFRPELEHEIQYRRELAMELSAALERGELAVHYQPIVDARTFDVCAMEALARWHNPLRGDISPALFIPIAEEVGLISRLGHFVLEEACRTAMHWPSNVGVSVNVSALQVARPDMLDVVKSILENSGLPAKRLEIEITESVMLNDDEANLHTLKALHDLGIAIVLDDFGTGFSSLSYLDRFTFDKIKIDRSFVLRANKFGGATAIIGAINNIAHAYNAVTTAEGVETFDQSQFLKNAGINQLQGYLFGAPHPAGDWTFDGGKALLRTENYRLA